MRPTTLLFALCCAPLAPAQAPPAQPPAAVLRENLITFDPQRVELEWRDNRWQLTANGVLLKDFGRRQADGREVQRLIRALGLTQLGTVGSPQPVMEYWLTRGQAPQGSPPGLRFTALDLANLRLDLVQEQWCVRDGARILFNFGPHRDEAEQALAVIHKYRFTHLAPVGHFPPAMTVFVSDPDGAAGSRLTAPATLAARTVRPGSPPQPAAPDPLPQGRQFGANELRPDLASLGEHVPFDWRQVQVRPEGREWRLAVGTYILARFTNERDARTALAAVQHYRFNQHCLSGRPDPAFSYFLVNGRAPQGVMFGINGTPFRPEALTVRQDNGRWVIGDSAQVLIDFGERMEEAQQTLKAIQRHHFDHLCRIGSAPGMTFLVRGR
jgi:hypothetical protein